MTASSLGVSYSDFLKLTPKKLWAIAEGKKLEKQRIDSDIWLAIGNYVLPAIKMGVRSGAWGKGELEYPSKPIYSDITKQESTEDEIQRKREEFVLNMKIRKANWDLMHPKNDKSEV